MKKTESKVFQHFRELLTTHKWEVEKLHGNIYQCGMPDTWCLGPHGLQVMVELKVGRKTSVAGLIAALRGRQKTVICRAMLRGADVYVLSVDGDLATWTKTCRDLQAPVAPRPLAEFIEELTALDCARA